MSTCTALPWTPPRRGVVAQAFRKTEVQVESAGILFSNQTLKPVEVQVESAVYPFQQSNFETGWGFQAGVEPAPALITVGVAGFDGELPALALALGVGVQALSKSQVQLKAMYAVSQVQGLKAGLFQAGVELSHRPPPTSEIHSRL